MQPDQSACVKPTSGRPWPGGSSLEDGPPIPGAPFFGLSCLPRVTIIDSEGERTVELAESSETVAALGRFFQREFPVPGTCVGVIYPLSPMLPLVWLGLLKAGHIPCILQNPTEKQTGEYWLRSVSHAIRSCGIDAVVGDGDPRLSGFGRITDLRRLDRETPLPDATGASSNEIVAGSILQLSSGTTGHRKGVRLTLAQLRSHVECYNRVLQLDPDDRIVSWLPLYHDMGFVACFVMPLFLGVPVVLIDPILWTRQPRILFEAIARHSGTVCFMPNFGFEVMSRAGGSPRLDSMRHWVSCSEPSREDTLRRFAANTGTSPHVLSTCYGMAENVFAVSQSEGLRLVERDGRTVVSCGRPIPGTDVKIVDGEVWVRSASSLRAYHGQPECIDADGYYATGDLGVLTKGELAILGRKHDVMIVAGRKHLLSDLDHMLNRVLPGCKGRGVSLAQENPTIGTQSPLYLVERPRFWIGGDRDMAAGQSLKAMTGIEVHQFESVPPRFITKTSSGKINRGQTLADWRRAVQWQQEVAPTGVAGPGLRDEVEQCFSSCPTAEPLGQWLDSLGVVVMRMLFEKHGLPWDPARTLNDAYQVPPVAERADHSDVFRIVSLLELPAYPFLDGSFVQEISRGLGVPVHFEHVCVPPSPVLLSDVVFHDYFLPRLDPGRTAAVVDTVRKLKRANLILIDDLGEFWIPNRTRWSDIAYARLNHSLTNDPAADLVGVRRARYHSGHQMLPRELVLAGDLPLESRGYSIAQLSKYLGVPILRVALHDDYRSFTNDWDVRCYHSDDAHEERSARIDPARFGDDLVAFARNHCAAPKHGQGRSVLELGDQGHYCSILVNREAVDWIAARHERFWICGLPSSVPYLEQVLRQMGKDYFFWNSLSEPPRPFDCVVQNGTWGLPRTDKPVYDIVIADRERGRSYAGGTAEPGCPSFRDPNARDRARRALRHAGIPDREHAPAQWEADGAASLQGRDGLCRALRDLAGRARASTGDRVIRLLELSDGQHCWQMVLDPIEGVEVATLEPDAERSQALRRAVPSLDVISGPFEHHVPREPYHGVFGQVTGARAEAVREALPNIRKWLCRDGELLLEAV